MSIKFAAAWVAGIFFLSCLTGCDMVNGWLGTTTGKKDQNEQASGTNKDESPSKQNNVSTRTLAFDNQKITIGSFNIQVLGISKFNDKAALDTIVKIIRYYDVIALQELRAQDQWVIPELVKLINEPGFGFNYIVGPRQGRTASKEQYVFLYDTNRIQLIDRPFMVSDPNDRIHREPMVARFKCLTDGTREGFTFMLMNIHTDPDETQQELDALADAVSYAYQYNNSNFSYEDDLIVVGDFNEAPNKFYRFGQVPGFAAAIPAEVKTNIKRTKCYDNIVFDRRTTTEFLNEADIFDYENKFNLTRSMAENVSDHLPVWGWFSIYESPQTDIASQGGTLR